MKEILVIIGCDTDPDRSDYLDDCPKDGLSWRGMLEGIPKLKKRLENSVDSAGNQPVISWCLRVDHQIKKIYGSYNYILETHRDLFQDLEDKGDELAWHPHFWRFDDRENKWYQDCFDSEWQVNMLREAHEDYMKSFPGRANSVRMGWDYHNTRTFGTLQTLGVQVDFSGIPGLRIDPKSRNQRSANFFDWSLSPNHPYYPSMADYRREADPGETSHRLLEAPNFVSRSIFWGMVSGMVLAKKMKDPRQISRAIRRPSYWVGITGKPAYFTPLVSQVDRELSKNDRVFFVTYFHPDELLPNKSNVYSLSNMHQNLDSLLLMAKRLGAETRFIPAKSIPEFL